MMVKLIFKFFWASVVLLGCVACHKAESKSEESPNIFCSIVSINYISNTTAEVTGNISCIFPSHVLSSPVAPDCLDELGVYYSESAVEAEEIVEKGVFVPMEYTFNKYGGSTFVRLKGLKPGRTYHCVSAFVRDGQRYYSSVEVFETDNRYIPEGAVDLGMDILWAACNLGAAAIEESGDLYAWGETETKDFFTEENYHYPEYLDGATSLFGYYDAASRKLGDGWRMPTRFDFEKLSMYDLARTTDMVNGVAGFRFTNPHTEQSIFLPFVPAEEGDNPSAFGDEDNYGAYLSSSLSRKEYPYFAVFSDNGWRWADYPFKLYYGFAIRPVYEHNN